MVLGDFGLATYDKKDSKIFEDGTPGYKASGEYWSTKGDIYSLGVTMHEMTEGGLPYDEAGSYVELPVEYYSKNLQQLMKRYTDTQPETRSDIQGVLSEV